MLCESNFWYDSCHTFECKNFHIRRYGERLTLIDTNSHLNRLNRKFGNVTIMEIPKNCDLYINDCVLDPEDWHNPILINNPNVNISRSLGFHPNTQAPQAFFSQAVRVLSEMTKFMPIQAFGPFGASHNKSDLNYSLQQILVEHHNSKHPHILPLLFYVIDNPLLAKQALDLAQIDQTAPIVWQNLNNTEPKSLLEFCSNIIEKHENHLICFNGKAFEYKYANRIQQVFLKYLNKLLIGTDVPQNIPSYCYNNDKFSYPLLIAKIVLAIHLRLVKIEQFKMFSLADTNNFLNSNAFSVFPKNRFNDLNFRAYQSYLSKMYKCLYVEYNCHISNRVLTQAKANSSQFKAANKTKEEGENSDLLPNKTGAIFFKNS